MLFVKEVIRPEDHQKFDLIRSDRWLFPAVASHEWVIDRETEAFIRLLRLYGRKNEPGDPQASYERDFHFHWKGRDFIVFSRVAIALEDFEGRQFGDSTDLQAGERVATFRVWAIWETLRDDFDTRFGIECEIQEFFEVLRSALSALIFRPLSSQDFPNEGGTARVILKVSTRVEAV